MNIKVRKKYEGEWQIKGRWIQYLGGNIALDNRQLIPTN